MAVPERNEAVARFGYEPISVVESMAILLMVRQENKRLDAVLSGPRFGQTVRSFCAAADDRGRRHFC